MFLSHFIFIFGGWGTGLFSRFCSISVFDIQNRGTKYTLSQTHITIVVLILIRERLRKKNLASPLSPKTTWV
jgi:hypothetical protein